MKARIIWFPELLTSLNYDYLADRDVVPFEKEKEHLKNVKKSMKEEGLLFPILAQWNKGENKYEIHAGHFRFKIAKEMGYDGIDTYVVKHNRDVIYMSEFGRMCYKHYQELKKLNNLKPENKFL